MVRVFSKPTCKQAKGLHSSNLSVEGDSVVTISCMTKKQGALWKLDRWLTQIVSIISKLDCFFSWAPCLVNHEAVWTKHYVYFVGENLPPSIVLNSVAIILRCAVRTHK